MSSQHALFAFKDLKKKENKQKLDLHGGFFFL